MPPRGSTAAVAKSPTVRKGAAPRPITTEYAEGLRAYSDILFKGGLCPKGISRPEGVAAIIEVGRDLGIPATQAIAGIKIIGGRPGVFGDLGMAMIRSSGLLEWVEEYYEGEPGTEGYTAVCRMKRKDDANPTERRFSVADAVRAKLWEKPGPWTEYPERMLRWRALSWACRDLFPDVLMGLAFVEELQDIPARHVETTTVDAQAIVDASAPGKLVVLPAGLTIVPGQAREDDPVKFLSPGPPDASAASADIGVKVTSGPITDEQLEQIADARELAMQAWGITSDDAVDKMWAEILADYDVTTARKLTGEQAHELLGDLRKYAAGEKSRPLSETATAEEATAEPAPTPEPEPAAEPAPAPKGKRRRPEPATAL